MYLFFCLFSQQETLDANYCKFGQNSYNLCLLPTIPPYNRFLNSQFKIAHLIKILRNSGSLLLRIWLEFSQSPDFVVLQFKMIYFIIRKNIFSHLDLALVAVAIFRAYAGVSTKNITLLNITHTF